MLRPNTQIRLRIHARRRASAYALVLTTALLVSIIGLSALTATRVVARGSLEQQALESARFASRSGLELAQRVIAQDPYWRTNLGSSVWKNWTSLGEAAFRIEAVDPVDGDPSNNDSDPIVITSTGRSGEALHKLQATIQTNAGSDLLAVAAHAQHDLSFDRVQFRADQRVSSNRDISASSGATVYADAYAAQNIGGSTYFGATHAGQTLRTTMIPSTITAAYSAIATPIQIAAIPAGTRELVVNGGFESGLTGWSPSPNSTVLAIDITRRRSGISSLFISNRSSPTDGIVQDVTSLVCNQRPFMLTAYARQFTSTVDVRMQLQITARATPTSPPTVTTFSTATTNAGGGFSKINGSVTPSWTGTLDSAKLIINTLTSTLAFYVDDVSFVRADLTSDPYIERVALTPNNNPFGATNSNGVYWIDCQGANLHIRDCRIFGTLILINPGSTTTVESSVSWRPAVSNYPLLVTDAGILITMSATALSESALNVNLNPLGSPAVSEGIGEDGDMLDTLPSKLNGLCFVGGDLLIGGVLDFTGVMLSSGEINFSGTSAQLTYDVRYPNNPPPGFNDTPRTVQLQRGSIRQIAN